MLLLFSIKQLKNKKNINKRKKNKNLYFKERNNYLNKYLFSLFY